MIRLRQFLPALMIAGLACTIVAYAQHPAMTTYNGAESCVTCHNGSFMFDAKEHALDIMESSHYKFRGLAKGVYLNDVELANEEHGKWTRQCGLPGSIATINWLGNFFNETVPGGCGRCHISNGVYNPTTGAANPEEAWKKIDCLLCHAETYKVDGAVLTAAGKRMPKSVDGVMQLPFPSGDDLTVSSTSIVQTPTADACNRCHAYNGGGYTFKRGNEYHTDDLHYAKGLSCVSCHPTEDHKIALAKPDPALIGRDNLDASILDQNRCQYCHTGAPHTGSNATILNSHFEKIDCSTCHQPFHKGMTNKRFDRPVQLLNSNGEFVQWTFELDVISEPTRPVYQWWNETVNFNVTPRGDMSDGKIYPWKITRAYVPVDKATNQIIPLKLGIVFGAPEASTNEEMQTKLDLSIRTGAKLTAAKYGFALDTAGNYVGEYEWEWDNMWGHPGHGTVKEGLTCTNCHTQESVLNFEDLGYSTERAEELRSLTVSANMPDRPITFMLNQNSPNPFTTSTDIQFGLPSATSVTLSVYNLAGKKIATLIHAQKEAGMHTVSFDASSLTPGIYFYRLEAGSHTITRKMVVMQ